jgi:hypothetical protein
MGHISDTDTLHIREVIGCHRQHPSPSIHNDLARSCWNEGRGLTKQAIADESNKQGHTTRYAGAGDANPQPLRHVTNVQSGRGLELFVRLATGLLPAGRFRTAPTPAERRDSRHWTPCRTRADISDWLPHIVPRKGSRCHCDAID